MDGEGAEENTESDWDWERVVLTSRVDSSSSGSVRGKSACVHIHVCAGISSTGTIFCVRSVIITAYNPKTMTKEHSHVQT